jgi:hypothetical protein
LSFGMTPNESFDSARRRICIWELEHSKFGTPGRRILALDVHE